MSAEAEKVWKASEEYIEMAIRHLCDPKAIRSTNERDAREEIRVSFLFPRVPEATRQKFEAARKMFLFAQTEEDKANLEDGRALFVADQIAAAVAENSKDLRAALPTLTPVHQEIIREYFLLQEPD